MHQQYYAFYLLTVIGIGYVLTESDLMKPFRMAVSTLNQKKIIQPFKWVIDKFHGVVNCIYCSSFWIGLVVYYLVYEDISKYMVLFAFSAMGTIYVVKNILNKN